MALVPYFEAGRIFLPDNYGYTDYQGVTQDLTKIFTTDEYLPFPFSAHDDMLDSLARILDRDLGASFPQGAYIDPFGVDSTLETTYAEYDPFQGV
jgi:hypothetical protein